MDDRCLRLMRAMAALVAVLALASPPAAGQEVPWYTMVHSGCPGDPGTFHPCALKEAKAFNPLRIPEDGKPDMHGYWLGPAGTVCSVRCATPDVHPVWISDSPNSRICGDRLEQHTRSLGYKTYPGVVSLAIDKER